MKIPLSSIGSKIYGGFLVISVMLLVVGGISYFQLRSVEGIATNQIMDKADARSISQDIIIKTGYISTLAEELFSTAAGERRVAIRVIVNDELRTLKEYFRIFADRKLTPDEQAIFARLESVFHVYCAVLGRALQSLDTETAVSADNLRLIEAFRSLHQQITTQLLQLSYLEGELMYRSWNAAQHRFHAVSSFILIFSALAFMICILLAVLITRSIKRPVSELVNVLEQYGNGDFSVRTDVKSRDEIEFFAHKFNIMLDQLQEAHQQLYDTIDFLPDATFVIDRDRKVVAWNRAIEAMTGVLSEEVIGKGNYAYAVPFHGKPRPVLVDLVFGSDPAVEAEYSSLERKGNSLYAEIYTPLLLENKDAWLWAIAAPLYDKNGELVGAIESIRDITDKKKLEEQFRQAQKMQAVGNLAGGIAHDFNNILTAIIGYGCLLQRKISGDDPLRSYVDQMLASSEKATQLVKSLLTFSRKQVTDPKPVQVNGIVRTIEKLLLRLIGEDILFSTDLTEAELMVMADSGQIEQVLMNLVTNARDAMLTGGDLAIETRLVELDEKSFKIREEWKPGRYALISVSDTGMGMDAKTRERIFEPFFTTKESGKGTGLGLAMVYSIIKQHNGMINVYSEPGMGTTFKIYLPLLGATAEEVKKNDAVSFDECGGHECILLAEDEVDVRSFMKDILEDFGYTVIVAVDGEEAVARFREHQGRIDYLILDVMMPKKNGKETYEEIRQIAPEIKALFLSGYTVDILRKKGVLGDGFDFLSKPVMPHVLLRKIRTSLEQSVDNIRDVV